MRKVQSYALILAGILLLWFASQASIKPARGTGRIIEDFREIPLELGNWYGEEGKMDDLSRQLLPYCALLNRNYENKQGYDSNLSIVYGVDLGDFHQPEVCMEGQGWRRVTSRTVRLLSKSPHPVVVLTMVSDYQQIVMLYWFGAKGTATTALGRHKVVAFWDRLKKGDLKPSAMIRLITPIEGDVKTAERITLDLAAALDPYISETLAKPPVFENTGTELLEE